QRSWLQHVTDDRFASQAAQHFGAVDVPRGGEHALPPSLPQCGHARAKVATTDDEFAHLLFPKNRRFGLLCRIYTVRGPYRRPPPIPAKEVHVSASAVTVK